MSALEPQEDLVRAIAASFSRGRVTRVRRFPTGLCHLVYEVAYSDGRSLVVRIAQRENERLLAGAIYWEKRLRSAGIPIAAILEADLGKRIFPVAYLILERLDGSYLEEVYPHLTTPTRVRLAQRMVDLQQAATALPRGAGFGYALSYEEPGPQASWQNVIEAHIAICRARMSADSPLRSANLDQLEKATMLLSSIFTEIEARPFLDDATTKNVIVDATGKLSGIVDVDTLCFGDSLFALALTRAAFAKLGYDPVYPDVWTTTLELSEAASVRLSLYTGLFAAVLLSEQGIHFNRDAAVAIAPAAIERLQTLFATAMGRVG